MPYDTRPRVAYVVKRYPRFSETFIVNEILAHEAAGLDIAIFALRPAEDSHFQDIIARVRAPVQYLPPRAGRAEDWWRKLGRAARVEPRIWRHLETARGATAVELLQAAALAAEIRRRGIDHLHAHFASTATTVARLAARFAGIGYSFTAHAKDIYHQDTDLDALRAKCRDARHVITVSDFNVDHLLHVVGVGSTPLSRIYNGLDLSAFPCQLPERRPPRILAVGRLVEKKGFDILVDACALLRERGVTFRCDIIGGGECEADLRARIGQQGLGDQVRLLGPRPQGEVKQALTGAAAFAAPCIVGRDGNRDGLPTVLLEAMALGTPCVSTDVTGIPEVLRHEDTGLEVPQGDAGALADALQRLLENPALRVRLARAARAFIEAHFDIHRNAARQRALCFPDPAAPHKEVGT